MQRLVTSCAVAALSVSLLACGFDDKKEREPRPADAEESMAIQQIVDQTAVMRSLVENGDNAADIVVAADYGPVKTLLDSAATDDGGSAAFKLPAPFPDCAALTPTSATFTDCEHEGHTVNGTVTLEGDPVTGATIGANLSDVFTLPNGTTGSATLTANGTISDTSVAGSVSVTAMVDPANFDAFDLAGSVTFTNVTLDAQWCPTGGTLVVSGTLDQGVVSFNRTVEVTLGPTCGEAIIHLQ